MKVIIGVASTEEVKAQFAQCLASMVRMGDMQYTFSVGSTCSQGRDSIALHAINSNADYVMFIDSDEVFPVDVLPKLIMDDKDIVSGLIMHRRPPFEPVLYDYVDGDWEERYEYPDEIFKVGCAGGGACTLIKVEALKKICEKTGHLFSPLPEETEDLSFARRAATTGVEWWCDPKVKLGHIGYIVVTEDFWDGKKVH